MLSFLLAPAMSFFSIRLYQKALRAGAKFGFLYLFYLTVLFSVFLAFIISFFFVPLSQGFSGWLIDMTPEITISQEGVQVSVNTPYSVTYPKMGTLYTIDPKRQMEDVGSLDHSPWVLLGKDFIAFRDAHTNSFRIHSIKKVMARAEARGRPFVITKELMSNLARALYKFSIPVAILILAPIFFIWKLIIILFYSMFAWLINLGLKRRNAFGSLFALSAIAVSPVSVLQVMNFSIPELYFDLNIFMAFFLTVTYLLYGLAVAGKRQ